MRIFFYKEKYKLKKKEKEKEIIGKNVVKRSQRSASTSSLRKNQFTKQNGNEKKSVSKGPILAISFIPMLVVFIFLVICVPYHFPNKRTLRTLKRHAILFNKP